MSRLVTISLLLISGLVILVLQACKKNDATPYIGTSLEFIKPAGWPTPAYNFDSNRLTVEGFALGRKLFYDGKLSMDGSVSCASCHQQYAAFTTYDHDFSHGINYKHGTRNAPTLSNLAWSNSFMWDGGITNLEQVTIAHITSPTEMGETINGVLKKLQVDATYRKLFRAAFGDENVTGERMTKALSQFALMIVSNNSRYDKMKRGEITFNIAENMGYDIFREKCAGCHAEPFFTDHSFRNIGLTINGSLKDYGRMRITGNSMDSLKFKVPTLRNVEWTIPYGHDGRFNSFDLLMEHYRSKVIDGPTTDPLVKNKIPVSNFEIGQIKAFLYTLTDTAFLNDKRFSSPD
ncbi:MAG: cytochrome-c peroxidase [Chitinophagaceae bacterium]|nr:cytochrome-c peroxidase [Chitinophagaceae bacterium]